MNTSLYLTYLSGMAHLTSLMILVFASAVTYTFSHKKIQYFTDFSVKKSKLQNEKYLKIFGANIILRKSRGVFSLKHS